MVRILLRDSSFQVKKVSDFLFHEFLNHDDTTNTTISIAANKASNHSLSYGRICLSKPMNEPAKPFKKSDSANSYVTTKTWAEKAFGINRNKSQNPTVWYQPFLNDGEHILREVGIKRKLSAFEIVNYLASVGTYFLVVLCIIYRKSLSDSLIPMIGLILFLIVPIIWTLNYQSWISMKWSHAVLTNKRLILKYHIFYEAIGCIDYKNITGIRIIARKFGKQLIAIDGAIEDLKKDIKSEAILKKFAKPILLKTDNAEQVRQVLEEAIGQVMGKGFAL
jgi:hypothetical protein